MCLQNKVTGYVLLGIFCTHFHGYLLGGTSLLAKLLSFFSFQERRKLPKSGWAFTFFLGGGHNLPPLVNKGFTDLPKPGWAIAHTFHPSPTSLLSFFSYPIFHRITHGMQSKYRLIIIKGCYHLTQNMKKVFTKIIHILFKIR